MVGKWYKYIGKSYNRYTDGKWYECVGDINDDGAFVDNEGKRNGFCERNEEYFDLSNPKDHNPDEVKEENEVFQSFKEYFEKDKIKKEESKPEKRCDTITIVLFPDGCTQIITTLTKFECIEELKKVLESEIKKINEGN
jgi:hypothetical protein